MTPVLIKDIKTNKLPMPFAFFEG